MGRYKNMEFNLSALKNTQNYIMYFDRLFELGASMFKYIDWPDTIDERYLEQTLLDQGKALFFKDEVLGFLGLPCTLRGRFDVYNIPEEREAYTANGYHALRFKDDSVIIFNNYRRKPSVPTIEMYALRLALIDRIIDINVNAQKTPLFIQCEENQRLTMKNLYLQYDGNQPIIFGDRGLNPNAIKVLRTEAPYLADDLYSLKTRIWAEALSYLGIPMPGEIKKERMTDDEITTQNFEAMANRNTRLKMRQTACKQIKEIFGINCWVEMDTETLWTRPEDVDDVQIDLNGFINKERKDDNG